MVARKNFFVKPVSKRARRRLIRELGTTGMSKAAIYTRVSHIVERQSKSSEDKKQGMAG
jgi:hypothetical protein